jgi:hypothetical protein
LNYFPEDIIIICVLGEFQSPNKCIQVEPMRPSPAPTNKERVNKNPIKHIKMG